MRLAVAATAAFGAAILEGLAQRHEIEVLLTRPDRPRGRGRRVGAPPAKEAALRLGVPVLQPEALSEAPRVTVIAPTATESDAFASALHVLDAERGLEIIEQRSGLRALLYYPASRERAARTETSDDFPRLHAFERNPTK